MNEGKNILENEAKLYNKDGIIYLYFLTSATGGRRWLDALTSGLFIYLDMRQQKAGYDLKKAFVRMDRLKLYNQ